MNGKANDPGRKADRPLTCSDCQAGLQEYLDGTLDKQLSLRFFLHLRSCETCQTQHAALQGLFTLLDNLPSCEVPADFDDAILASVPYAAYQAMEPLRRERVPVYLSEHFLPRFLRSPVTRAAGLLLAALALSIHLKGVGSDWPLVLTSVGVVPEAIVRLQGIGRRLVGLGRT